MSTNNHHIISLLSLLSPVILTMTFTAHASEIAPRPVPAVNICEYRNPGDILVTWEPPIYDVEDNMLDREHLTYMLYYVKADGTQLPLFDHPLISRTLIYPLCTPEEKVFAQFAVMVYNNGIPANETTLSGRFAVGLSEPLPYLNSFAPYNLNNQILEVSYPDGSYDTPTLTSVSEVGITAADDDQYILLAKQRGELSSQTVRTGKINISDIDRPELSIRHYKWDADDKNVIRISAIEAESKDIPLATIDHAECKIGWNTATISLNGIRGRKPQISITSDFITHDRMVYDTLAIYDYVDAVEEIEDTDYSIEIAGDQVCIAGLGETDRWYLYNLSGSLLQSGQGDNNMRLSTGTYILITPMHSHKILLP